MYLWERIRISANKILVLRGTYCISVKTGLYTYVNFPLRPCLWHAHTFLHLFSLERARDAAPQFYHMYFIIQELFSDTPHCFGRSHKKRAICSVGFSAHKCVRQNLQKIFANFLQWSRLCTCISPGWHYRCSRRIHVCLIHPGSGRPILRQDEQRCYVPSCDGVIFADLLFGSILGLRGHRKMELSEAITVKHRSSRTRNRFCFQRNPQPPTPITNKGRRTPGARTTTKQ